MNIIDSLFVRHTARLLEFFGEPDASFRHADGFAAAFETGRFVPSLHADDSERNDSSAIVRTLDMRTLDGLDYRIVICAIDRDAAQRVEAELCRELDSGVIHAGRGAFV
jgi:hypothetical protein